MLCGLFTSGNMRGTIFLLIAIILTFILFVPLLILQSSGKGSSVRDEYHFNIACNMDYVWGSLIFGRHADGHTVSALVFKYDIPWAIKSIDKIFYFFLKEVNHCQIAYADEFIINDEL